MEPLTVLSAVEQVAEHLRRELLRGTLRETMPGVNPLVAELGVGHKTVKAALRMLENEGLLVNQGRGTKRLITLPEDHATPALRVSVLEFLPPDQSDPWIVNQWMIRFAHPTGRLCSRSTRPALLSRLRGNDENSSLNFELADQRFQLFT